MTQDGLNGADVRACVVHERGHGVSEDVANAWPVNIGDLDVSTPVLGKRIGINGRAEQREKERAFFGIDG